MYPPTAASQRLVRLTSAAGSGVSVRVKHEVKLVLGKSNRQYLVLLFLSGHIGLTEHKVMFHKLFIY